MIDSLHIENFRSLQDFQVKRLGRVNLIVGKNNSGKSTVLEALRIYAGNANRALLERIATEHDEKIKIAPEDIADLSESDSMPFEAFFSGRKYPNSDDAPIIIGQSRSDPEALIIRHGFLEEVEETLNVDGELETRISRREISRSEAAASTQYLSQALFVTKGDRSYRLRFDLSSSRIRATSIQELGPPTPCGFVPTRFVSPNELADEWDSIVLTKYEETVYSALKIINSNFNALAFVSEEDPVKIRNRAELRVPKIRLDGAYRPVPLNSMGDGMSRILQLVFKAYSAKNGFLLIDEFENGLHYSVQGKVWELIFELANKLKIQVFATTHSWDCVENFSKIAIARKDVEGILFRVGTSVRSSDFGRVIATTFDEDELVGITQSDLEVR